MPAALKKDATKTLKIRPAFATSLNKHQQRTEQTKGKLLKAALQVFSRDGFEAARIEDIAIKSGHTRGAFYAHFRRKEDIFFALLEAETQKRREEIRQVLESRSGEPGRLEALRDYYATGLADGRWSILLLEFKLYAIRHPRLRAELAEAHRSIRTKMRLEGLERLLPGVFQKSSEDQERKRVLLEVIRNGLAVERAYDPVNLSEAQTTDWLKQMFDALIGPARAPK